MKFKRISVPGEAEVDLDASSRRAPMARRGELNVAPRHCISGKRETDVNVR